MDANEELEKQRSRLWREEQAKFGEVLDARDADDATVYFRAIQRLYEMHAPMIAEGRYEPLFVPWKLLFTPIEREAWEEIQIARLRMFPQYPVLNYFLDFADPWTKVAVECDGKAFHTDAARDGARDALLRKQGWIVVRVSGKAIWRELPVDEDPEVEPEPRQYDTRRWIDDVIYWVRSRTPGLTDVQE